MSDQDNSGQSFGGQVRSNFSPAADDLPPRIRSWLRSLLDLSFKNPLLRIGGARGDSAAYRFELPSGLLSLIEDRLMDGRAIEVRVATQAPDVLRTDPTNMAALSDFFVKSGHLFAPNIESYEGDSNRRLAELASSEPNLSSERLESKVKSDLTTQYVKTLDKRLGGLRRKAREVETQTGANTLFLTIGTLHWSEPETSSGRPSNNIGRAPLFLIPVRLSGTGRAGYRITVDDLSEVEPNYCLLEKLRETYKLTIHDLERPATDDSGIDVDRMIAKVREALADANIPDASVTEDAYLAVLNFSTFRLWKDLRENWTLFLESPVVRHLVYHQHETFIEPEPLRDDSSEEVLCPIECDQSQLEAVRMAVAGRSFVLEGPPGTGKSQTIANVLAASIAAGKKVLFVAEKQAALTVVKKRLDAVGLGAFCLDLHDKGSKPEQIRQQIRDSLDYPVADWRLEWEDLDARWKADRAVLDDYSSALHDPGPNGRSAWKAREAQLNLGEGERFEIPPEYLQVGADMKVAVRNALLDLPRVVGEQRIEPQAAWSLSELTNFETVDRSVLRDTVTSLSRLSDALANQDPTLRSVASAIQGPNGFSAVERMLDLASAGRMLSDDELAQVCAPDWNVRCKRALTRLGNFQSKHEAALAAFLPEAFSTDLDQVIDAGIEAAGAGILTRGKKNKLFHAQISAFLKPDSEHPTNQLLALLQDIHASQAELNDCCKEIDRLPGLRPAPGWSPFDPSVVEGFEATLKRVAVDAELQASPEGATIRTALQSGWNPARNLPDLMREAAQSWRTFFQLLETTPESQDRWRNGRSFFAAWEASALSWQQDTRGFLALRRWSDLLATLRPLKEAGLSEIFRAVLQGDVAPGAASEHYQRGLIAAEMDERLESGRIDLFDGRKHDRRIADFRARDSERRAMLRTRIPSELVERRGIRRGQLIGKWGALASDLARKKRGLSVRNLVKRYDDILPGLTPCFLMSPDSVARFIPPGSITFDMVVFDEASQIKVPESIGALGRARSVVVVGDTRQMPPSQFGGGSASDLDEQFDMDDEAVEDLESILSECVESNLPQLYLECHYRSRHEGLISFSNEHFYENRLTTFPSPAGPDVAPIRWVRVSGQYNRTGPRDQIRTNLVEAQAIVADIMQRIHDPLTQHESIGVVTFNIQQQRLIYQLLDESGDPLLQELLEDDSEKGLIVRNLESVQGDERDVIMLSIAFSPEEKTDASGAVSRNLPLRFGPLNNKGGERRLNVAVTRARNQVVIYCSFDPHEMLLKHDSARGLQLLRSYLLQASSSDLSTEAQATQKPAPSSAHRSQIANALRAKGFKVRENVGLSNFRIDLTVGRPQDRDWSVAILLDGPDWANRSTVYDRDALPPSVLQGAMGWKRVERVWFPMWLTAKDEVLSDIERAVESAHAVSLNTDAALHDSPSEPPLSSEVRTSGGTREEINLRSDPEREPAAVSARDSMAAQGYVAPELLPTHIDRPEASEPDLVAAHEIREAATEPGATAKDNRLPNLVQHALLGGQDVLDRLSEPAQRLLVEGAIHDALKTLLPVEAAVFAKSIGKRFDYAKLRRNRVDAILDLVPSARRRKSQLGEFIWPEHLDPQTWEGYAGADQPGGERPIDEVSPEELTNAMFDLVRQGIEINADDLLRAVAQEFGTMRLGKEVRARLEAILDLAINNGRLQQSGGIVLIARIQNA